MKKRLIGLFLLLPLLSGCDLFFPDPQVATPTPEVTSTPIATIEPTATPNIPTVDESLPSLESLTELPIESWPEEIRMPYLHSAGIIAQSPAKLIRSEQKYLIYTLQNTGDVAATSFALTQEDGQERIYPVPSNPNPYDTGEGLVFLDVANQDAQALLRNMISQYETDEYVLTADEDLSYWNNLIDAQSTLFGALPYVGRYVSLQKSDTVIRIFYINGDTQDLIVTMQVEEIGATPPMFYYLCAMLSTLRVTG